MQRRMWNAIAAVALAGSAGAPAIADVKAGVDAWQAGNFAGAIKEWRPLADRGDADAQFNMGQAYKLGRGVSQDLRVARSWYQKAADQGHDQAGANLGLILFQSGERAAAMPWIRKAADSGDPRAQYVLGTALFNGDFATKDWPRAYALMTRAAAQGLPQAGASLAQMDKYIPLPDRQKGITLARQMTGQGTSSDPQPLPPKAPRIAGAVPSAKAPPAKAAAPSAKAPPAQTAPAAARIAGKWRIQLGAYGNEAGARAQWAVLGKKIPGLAGLQPSFEKAGALTRLRGGPLANRAEADKLCAAAKGAGQPCFPVAP